MPHFENDFIIKDHSGDFAKLIEQADKLVEHAHWDNKIKQIHYDNIKNSNFTFWLTIILTIALVILGLFICYYAYTRFYSINNWMKLAAQILGSHEMNNLEEIRTKNSNEQNN